MSKQEILKEYVIPFLDKVKEGKLTESELKILPDMIKLLLAYASSK